MSEIDTDLVGDFLQHLVDEHDISTWLVWSLESKYNIRQWAESFVAGCAYGTYHFRNVPRDDLVEFVIGGTS